MKTLQPKVRWGFVVGTSMRQGTHTRLPFSMVLMLVSLLFGSALDAGGMSVPASGRNVQNPRSSMCDRSISI